MENIYIVEFSKQAERDLKKIPWNLVLKLESWVMAVGLCGLHEVRKVRGYRDELLKGDRAGQHSIRLNKAYRAIYIVDDNEGVKFVEIIEVTKHDY